MSKMFLLMVALCSFPIFSVVSFSSSQPCDPATNSGCKMYTGTVSGVGQHNKVPGGYFFSRRGVQRGWLVADGQSHGTWRIRIMNWKKMSTQETQNHFHQMAQSDLQAAGPIQEITAEVGEGLYQHQIECEDDCTNKSFTYYFQVP